MTNRKYQEDLRKNSVTAYEHKMIHTIEYVLKSKQIAKNQMTCWMNDINHDDLWDTKNRR